MGVRKRAAVPCDGRDVSGTSGLRSAFTARAAFCLLVNPRRFRVKRKNSGVTSEVMIVKLVVKCASDAFYKLQHNARLP